jgi:hypothetical protein
MLIKKKTIVFVAKIKEIERKIINGKDIFNLKFYQT